MLKTWLISKPLILSEAGPLWPGNRERTRAKYERLLWNILEVEITGHQSRNGSLGSQKRRSILGVRCNYLYFDTTHSVTPNPQRWNCSGVVRMDSFFVNDNIEFVLRHRWTTLSTTWMLFPRRITPFWLRFYSASNEAITKCPWIFFSFYRSHLCRFGEKKRKKMFLQMMKVGQGFFHVQFPCSSTAQMMHLGERKPGKL